MGVLIASTVVSPSASRVPDCAGAAGNTVVTKAPRAVLRGAFSTAWATALLVFVQLAFAQALPAAASPLADDNCPPPGPGETVRIRTVIDGDTVILRDGRHVRLIGIDATETGRDGAPDEPFARAATAALAGMFADSDRAYLVVGEEEKDRYGRTLAHLYDRNGNSAEAHLVRQGLAYPIAVPPNLALAVCLAALEDRARSGGLALWGEDGIAPVAAPRVEEGGFQRVRGRVERITFADAWWLDLEGRLAGVIYPEHQHRFQRDQIKALEGKVVELRGWVYANRGSRGKPWRVRVETPYAIED